jgi:HlyD family secretion protein
VETKEYERQLDLVGRKLVSDSSVDRQRAARDGARAAQRASAARLEELTTGTRAEQIAQAKETLASREAAVHALEIDAARLDVVAPRAGLIDALPFELGEHPPAGAPVVVLLADGAPYARVYVPEPLRVRATAGTDVRVRVDGVANELAGRVRWVSSDAAFTPYYALTQKDRSRLSFLAEITLTDAAAERLPAGMPVEVRLLPDAARDAETTAAAAAPEPRP